MLGLNNLISEKFYNTYILRFNFNDKMHTALQLHIQFYKNKQIFVIFIFNCVIKVLFKQTRFLVILE